MNAHSRLDRESFQALLANAFAVQESGMDSQSLSALVEVQRSIATGEPNVERTLHLIAELALNVANAAGIAIALLKADELVYLAGSGTICRPPNRQIARCVHHRQGHWRRIPSSALEFCGNFVALACTNCHK
jgi:hypothetical protein